MPSVARMRAATRPDISLRPLGPARRVGWGTAHRGNDMGSSFFAMQLAELRRQRGEEQRTCPAGDASVTYTSPGEQPIRCVNEAIDEIDHHIYEIIRAVQGPARLAKGWNFLVFSHRINCLQLYFPW